MKMFDDITGLTKTVITAWQMFGTTGKVTLGTLGGTSLVGIINIITWLIP